MDEQKTTPFLSAEEEQILLEVHRALKDKRKAYRINAIILLNKGYTKQEIERILLIDRKSIIKYEKDYRIGGVDRLLRDEYISYCGKLSESEKEILKQDLRENLFVTAKAICEHIRKKFKKNYSNDGIVKLLHSLGFSYKKTKVVPAKADREKQEQFVEKYQKLRRKIKENEGLYFLGGGVPRAPGGAERAAPRGEDDGPGGRAPQPAAS